MVCGGDDFYFLLLKRRGFHSTAYIAWSLLQSTEHFWLSATCTAALRPQHRTEEQDRDFRPLYHTPALCSLLGNLVRFCSSVWEVGGGRWSFHLNILRPWTENAVSSLTALLYFF